MKIGITYDLRDDYLIRGFSPEEAAEFDSRYTIEAIAAALTALGHSADPIGGISVLVERLAAGERWDLVFNIAEGVRGFGREAQVPALLDAYEIPYTFSDPLVLALCLHKGLTKSVCRDAGVPTADFQVVTEAADIRQVRLPLPLFAKPVAEGTGKGITRHSVIRTRKELKQVCTALLDRFRQPILVERFLPGREVTVGIIGSGRKARAVGTLAIELKPESEQEVYSYLNKEQCEELVSYHLAPPEVAERAEEIALLAWRRLGCRDAGRVDLREDEQGRFCFMEVNPLAGLHPTHSDLPIVCRLKDISYLQLIAAILESANSRRLQDSRRLTMG
jgi:D-alanine-D-alanine ligase